MHSVGSSTTRASVRALLCISGVVAGGAAGGSAGHAGVIDTDVIIVGAGQAGMAAAHLLTNKGYSVRVLEATDHVGGRTRNFDLGAGRFDAATDDALEVGGTWLSPNHTAALDLCRELGIGVYDASFAGPGAGPAVDPAEGEAYPWWFWGADYPAAQRPGLKPTVFHSSSGTFRFRTPSELRAGLGSQVRGELERAGAAIVQAVANVSDICWESPAVPPAGRALDRFSTGGYLSRELRSPEAVSMMRSCIHGKNAHEAEEVSLLYNLLSFKGCNSAGADSQYRVRGGTQAIPLAIAARLGDKVSLGDPVASVRGSMRQEGVRLRTRSGQEYRAAAAIITGPPPAVLGIDFEPPLPGVHAQLLQRMPMGTSMKFAAVYSQGPWWRELGLQGDVLSAAVPGKFSLPPPDEGTPLFVECVDHSPFSRRFGVIVCFVEGRQNLHLMTLSTEQQQGLLTAFLEHSFNDSRAATLRPTFVAHDWAGQPFARGAYTGFLPPGVLSIPQYWGAYREMEKLPGVFLAGADYHAGFGNGYIEGAIRDGYRAAERAHAKLRARSGPKPLSQLII